MSKRLLQLVLYVFLFIIGWAAIIAVITYLVD
ncbi:hypothetical protein Nther_1859 [Natranaerobius thermophilus JW/NM-WN-LF]|uniref:Uncharacterized protein n=1 Tax=Natranaerobius thermophilus (strain ATCC BAA-1301 / DSM 18059 / JW/NM-WN-LF) TaxID=457570 RepID=B2A614_NATTJ|nr:hypothetical protein Nther_1859 [Natranaerobius thermophilus JW/NM-WN-LF]